jgi:hypothetical protein
MAESLPGFTSADKVGKALEPTIKTERTKCPTCHISKAPWCHLCADGTKWGVPKIFPPQAAFKALLEDRGNTSVILASRPGTGKTWAIRFSIEHQKATGRFRKAIVLEPLKALATQVIRELTQWFPGMKLAEVTGDTVDIIGMGDERNKAILDADLIVATYEVFEAMTRQPEVYTALSALSLLYVDEIHMLGNERRGGILDTGLTRFLLGHGANIQMIGASATVANTEDLKTWLAQLTPDVEVVSSDFSPMNVQLDPRIWVYSRGNKERASALAKLAINAIREKQGPVILMTLNRSLTWSVAKEVQKVLGEKAAAVHNAALSRSEREKVEQNFRAKLIPVLVSTPTLQAGINMPCRTAILDTTYWNVEEFRPDCIDIGSILQTAGRAGRLPDWTTAYVKLVALEDPHWGQKFNMGQVGRSPSLEVSPPEFQATSAQMEELREFSQLLSKDNMDWVRKRAVRAGVSIYAVLHAVKKQFEVFKEDGHDDEKAIRFALVRAKVEAPGGESNERDPSPLEELERQLNSPSLVSGKLIATMETTVNSQIAMSNREILPDEVISFLKHTFSWHTARERKWGSSCRILPMDGNMRYRPSPIGKYHMLEGMPLAFHPPAKVKVLEGPLQEEEATERFKESLTWLRDHRFIGKKDDGYVSEKKGVLTHRSGLHPQRVERMLQAINHDVPANGEAFLSMIAEAYDCQNRKERVDTYRGFMRYDWLCEHSPLTGTENAVNRIVWWFRPEERFGDDIGQEVPLLDMVIKPLVAGTKSMENYRLIRQWAIMDGAPLPICRIGAWLEEHKVYDYNTKKLLFSYLNGTRIVEGKLYRPKKPWRVPLEVKGLARVMDEGEPELLDYRDDPAEMQKVMHDFERVINRMASDIKPDYA